MENKLFSIFLLLCLSTIVSVHIAEEKGEVLQLLYDKNGDGKLDDEELIQAHNKSSVLSLDDPHKGSVHPPPSQFESWVYGIGSCLGISVLSLLGVVLFPIKSQAKDSVMSLMLAFAVGTMLSTVFYDLLPTIYGVHSHISEQAHPADKSTYMWRTTVILGSIIFFFIFERQLMISVHRFHNHHGGLPSDHHHDLHNHFDNEALHSADEAQRSLLSKHERKPSYNTDFLVSPPHEHNERSPKLPAHYAHAINHPIPVENNDRWWSNIQPYAFINLFADAIHNFADGVAIGAAYSISLQTGIAVTVAMLVHEIPEGLGDFVILIKAGMSRKMAIVCNLLSAFLRVIGVLSGLVIAHISISATTWMLCFSIGGFLYITLTNMVHELYHEGGRWHILWQAGCIILGYSVLFVYIMWGE